MPRLPSDILPYENMQCEGNGHYVRVRRCMTSACNVISISDCCDSLPIARCTHTLSLAGIYSTDHMVQQLFKNWKASQGWEYHMHMLPYCSAQRKQHIRGRVPVAWGLLLCPELCTASVLLFWQLCLLYLLLGKEHAYIQSSRRSAFTKQTGYFAKPVSDFLVGICFFLPSMPLLMAYGL